MSTEEKEEIVEWNRLHEEFNRRFDKTLSEFKKFSEDKKGYLVIGNITEYDSCNSWHDSINEEKLKFQESSIKKGGEYPKSSAIVSLSELKPMTSVENSKIKCDKAEMAINIISLGEHDDVEYLFCGLHIPAVYSENSVYKKARDRTKALVEHLFDEYKGKKIIFGGDFNGLEFLILHAIQNKQKYNRIQPKINNIVMPTGFGGGI